MNTKPTLHRDATITYWSVYQQSWMRKASKIPHAELAAMRQETRKTVMRHLSKRAT